MLTARIFGSGNYVSLTHGSGVLSIGSGFTITDDTYFNSFPCIVRTETGSLLLAYTKSLNGGEGGDTSENIVGRTSSDEGGTWSAEAEVYDPPAVIGASNMGLQRISTGRIFTTVTLGEEGVLGGSGLVYSDDNGATWTWVPLTTSFTTADIAVGPVCEMPNGDLLVTVEGYNSGQALANRSSHTLRSTDGGVTWGSEVSVAEYADWGVPFYEAQLVRLGATVLHISHNDHISRICTSTDYGLTWSAPVTAFAIASKPNVRVLASGTLMVVGRRESDGGTIAYTSIDVGSSWSSAYVLDASHYMVYGDVVRLNDGRYLVVYSSETSGTDADIKAIYVTEE